MTEGTCKDGLQVKRLDRTRPPPGYTLTPSCGVWVADERGELIREDESFDDEASAIAAAWAHYEREHDPPGLETWEDPEYGWWFFGLGSDFEWYADLQAKTGARQNPGAERKDARAAAWAWYWRRVAVANEIGTRVVVIVEHFDFGGDKFRRVPTLREHVAAALLPMLTVDPDPSDDWREEAAESAETLLAEGRLTFEGDPPIELAAVDTWPRCLAWPDEQVSAVERWLAEGGELPEVLRA